MFGPFGHHFAHHPSMMGCCCGPWGWQKPDKEQRLQWLNSYKEGLEKELSRINDEIERTKKEQA